MKMRKYFRFIVVTLLFMVFIAYVIVLSRPQQITGWSQKDREDWIDSCIGIGIGDRDLCSCVLSKLQLRYTSIEEMYKNPQKMAASMRSISLECKD